MVANTEKHKALKSWTKHILAGNLCNLAAFSSLEKVDNIVWKSRLCWCIIDFALFNHCFQKSALLKIELACYLQLRLLILTLIIEDLKKRSCFLKNIQIIYLHTNNKYTDGTGLFSPAVSVWTVLVWPIQSWDFSVLVISVRLWNLAEILHVNVLMQMDLNQQTVLLKKKTTSMTQDPRVNHHQHDFNYYQQEN